MTFLIRLRSVDRSVDHRVDRKVRCRFVLTAFGMLILLVSAGLAGAQAPGESVAGDSVVQEQRLVAALEAYARAQSESERDARLAGFSRARQGFSALIDAGIRTAPLYVNLGNASLQAQDLGGAVLAYHRALLIDPENNAAKQNLVHLRSRLPSWVPTPDASDGARGFLDARRWPAAQRRMFAAACFLIAAISIGISVRRKEGAWRGLAILATTGWALALGSSLGTSLKGEPALAVITGEEVAARSADSLLAPLALPEALPAGVEVDLLEARGDWARVRLANGRDVWVRSSSVTAVD